MKDSKLLWFGVSTLILGGMVYLADLSEVLEAVQRADPLYLGAAFVTGFSIFGVWNYTWYRFFQTIDLGLGYWGTARLFMSGHFLNSITPLGQFGGEPFMAYIISSNTGSSYEKAFSTVLSADIVNMVPALTFMLGGAVYLVFLGSLNEIILDAIYLSLLATAVGGALVYVLWFEAGLIEGAIVRVLRKISRLIGRGGGLVDSVEERMDRVEENFRRIGENPRHLFKTAVVVHLGFVLEVVTMYLLLLSVGFEASFAPLYFILPLAALAELSPTPGGTGTYEAALAGLLTVFFPLSFATAVVAAVLFRLTFFWPGILVGYLTFNSLDNGWS